MIKYTSCYSYGRLLAKNLRKHLILLEKGYRTGKAQNSLFFDWASLEEVSSSMTWKKWEKMAIIMLVTENLKTVGLWKADTKRRGNTSISLSCRPCNMLWGVDVLMHYFIFGLLCRIEIRKHILVALKVEKHSEQQKPLAL